MSYKRILRRPVLQFLAAVTLAAPLATATSAQSAKFPDRPLSLVVPYAPGATTDQIARAVADRMGRELGQTVVVENRAGGNGIIAATHIAQSRPDGYAMLLSSDSTSVLNPMLYHRLSYNADRDLRAVALLSDLPVIMMVNPKLPVSNLSEFVAYAKAHPGKINYSSTGNGGTFHLAGELFSQAAGIEITHIPYKGGAPALQALMANEVQALFGVVGSALPQIRAGKVRPMAVATRDRLPLLPDVPTFSELGFPDYVVLVRYGLMVPAATPDEHVARLAAAANKALAEPALRKTFTDLGFILPAQSSPQAYSALIQSDRALWADLIQRKQISLD
ncbi:Tripartite tricarboxylate transporter family receptor [compost metagenome]